MKFHIVSMNEKINDILLTYEITLDELKEANKHIRDISKIVPGTKLKIPTITETIDQDIMDMEPFVEDYYPKKPIESLDEVRLDIEEDILPSDENISNEEASTEETLTEKISNKDDNRNFNNENQKNLEDKEIKKEVVYVYYPAFIYIPVYKK